MEEKLINEFIEKVKIEATYRKVVEKDIINQMIKTLKKDYHKQPYPQKVQNTLELALQFYKDYNPQYYNMILEGIKNEKIIINQESGKSFTDISSNKTHISLRGNDGDLFLLVHEFAHFIDRNSNPTVIPYEYNFLAEVFSFYMEKKLETWLGSKKYKDLIMIRANNRLYFESKMLEAIENELYYEELYKENGIIEEDIDIGKIKSIMDYENPNLVNYLLRYPLGNIISAHLINNNLIKCDNEIAKVCLDINLYEILNNYSTNKTIKHLLKIQ